MDSANGSQPVSPPELRSKDFYTWLVAIFTIFGLILTIYCFFLTIRDRGRLKFLPHLFSITLGNVVFLVLIGLQQVIVTDFWPKPGLHGCKFIFYLLTVTKEFPYLCMVAISMEQMQVVFQNPFVKLRPLRFKEHIFVVSTLLLLCSGGSFWSIMLTTIDANGNCSREDYGHPLVRHYAPIIQAFVFNFTPIVAMTVSHIGLIYKLSLQCNYRTNIQILNRVGSYKSSRRKKIRSPRAKLSYASLVELARVKNTATTVFAAGRRISRKVEQKRRRTIFQLIGLITVVTTLNFPTYITNITERFGIDTEQNMPALPHISHALFHFQFAITALYVRLPLFKIRFSEAAILLNRR